MTMVVRRCAHCGSLDRTQHWESRDAAADQGAPGASWVCPTCGSSDAELVDDDAPDEPGIVKPINAAPAMH